MCGALNWNLHLCFYVYRIVQSRGPHLYQDPGVSCGGYCGSVVYLCVYILWLTRVRAAVKEVSRVLGRHWVLSGLYLDSLKLYLTLLFSFTLNVKSYFRDFQIKMRIYHPNKNIGVECVNLLCSRSTNILLQQLWVYGKGFCFSCVFFYR